MSAVVIVGGGVIGLATAWRLASAGVRVTVYDETPMHGASWAAAGMLAPAAEVRYGEEALLELNRESARRYPDFVAELEAVSGMLVNYRRCGTLLVGRTRDDLLQIDEHFRYVRLLGLQAEELTARQCRFLEAGLSPSISGGMLLADDHQVDNRRFLQALYIAGSRAGVEFERSSVERIEVVAGRVTGIVAGNGDVRNVSSVVLAAGADCANIDGIAGQLPSLRPVFGEIIRLHAPQQMAVRVVRAIVRGAEMYVVCRPDGGVVVGATTSERALLEGPTAGAIHRLLDDAREVLPEIDEATFVEAIARRRPATPDCAPVIGESNIEGLLLASGHYRNGMLLAPVTADVITRLITHGELADIAKPFTAARFALTGAAK
jgi:glycine oxidase